ncbi:hypothetical protein BIV57_06625 [Mangrovactinospora gilvigrisea]|uniref:Major facilitator superfamily (MFS) profile domain-containing protein n=1 Tax=Mangrovactinospora gilvigrisea TaxID=1428644 RepID=A0A1J7C9X3_9ACTN|nr:MFS transporter [Mangrovactinospora gilvigrisea]OIV38328.1 hypothetical protein BIV57_06625 [Mangrovactinospora gilvigrisea]
MSVSRASTVPASTPPEAAASGPPAAPAAPRRAGVALAVILVAQLMFILDASVVNVGLPAIRSQLGFSATGLTWVVTAYSVAFGGLLTLGGRAGDLFGRRRLFLAGIALFTLSSAAAGVAQTSGQLLAARAVQGLAAACASPSTLALISTLFSGERRNRALSVFSAIIAAGATLGLLIGGLLVQYASWRWTMFLNVPIGIVALLLIPRFVPETERHPGRLDIAGALTSGLGIAIAVYAFNRAAQHGWSDGVALVGFAATALLVAAFLVNETRVENPLLPLRLFADRARAASFTAMFLMPAAMFSVFYFLTLYMQGHGGGMLGFSPLRTGAGFVPMTGPLLVVAGLQLAPRIMQRTGPKPVAVAGGVLAVAGLVWLTALSPGDGYGASLIGPLALIGTGMPFVMAPMNIAILTTVGPADAGAAAGALQALQQSGAALGVAVLTTVATAGGGGVAGMADGFRVGTGFAALVLLLAAFALRGSVLPRRPSVRG